MRIAFILIFSLLVCKSFSQDKKLLQKQLTDIMIDYPNKFKNLKNKKDSFYLKFQISGTTDTAMVLTFDKKTYISALLSTPRSDEEAKSLFDKWTNLISSITLNGVKLIPKECSKGKWRVFCNEWTLDNSKNNIAPLFLPFKIEVEVIKINSSLAAGLKIRDL